MMDYYERVRRVGLHRSHTIAYTDSVFNLQDARSASDFQKLLACEEAQRQLEFPEEVLENHLESDRCQGRIFF
jgi:hypothetical protein